jgi:hypothetical protein
MAVLFFVVVRPRISCDPKFRAQRDFVTIDIHGTTCSDNEHVRWLDWLLP